MNKLYIHIYCKFNTESTI